MSAGVLIVLLMMMMRILLMMQRVVHVQLLLVRYPVVLQMMTDRHGRRLHRRQMREALQPALILVRTVAPCAIVLPVRRRQILLLLLLILVRTPAGAWRAPRADLHRRHGLVRAPHAQIRLLVEHLAEALLLWEHHVHTPHRRCDAFRVLLLLLLFLQMRVLLLLLLLLLLLEVVVVVVVVVVRMVVVVIRRRRERGLGLVAVHREHVTAGDACPSVGTEASATDVAVRRC